MVMISCRQVGGAVDKSSFFLPEAVGTQTSTKWQRRRKDATTCCRDGSFPGSSRGVSAECSARHVALLFSSETRELSALHFPTQQVQPHTFRKKTTATKNKTLGHMDSDDKVLFCPAGLPGDGRHPSLRSERAVCDVTKGTRDHPQPGFDSAH